MNIFSYFCPFSKKFNSCEDFRSLTAPQKALTVIATIVASVFSLPFFGLGGVAAFRGMVEKYSFKKIELNPAVSERENAPPQQKTAQKIHQLLVQDMGMLQVNPEIGSLLSQVAEKNLAEITFTKPSPRPFKPAEPSFKELKLPFDQMSPDELQACKKLIDKNPAAKETADKKFFKEAEAARERALACHETFKERFDAGKAMPYMDPETGVCFSSLFQLKTAIKMAREAFPGLTMMALTEEQSLEVARLVQLVLCGSSALEMPYPATPNCFSLIELKGKKMEAQQVPAGDLAKNTSLIDEFLQKIEKSKKGHEEHIFGNVKAALSMFCKDSLVRTLNTYCSGAIRIPLGLKMNENQNLPGAFVGEMRQAFVKFLLSHPDKVKDMIAANSQAKYLTIIKTMLGTDGMEDALEHSAFPEIYLERLLEGVRHEYKGNAAVQKNLDAIVNHCRMDQKEIEEIAAKSKCDPKEIEPLVRIKALEMIMLMSQANQFEATLALHQTLSSFCEEDPSCGLIYTGTSADFDFPLSENNHQGDFGTVVNRLFFRIEIKSEDFGFAEMPDSFLPKVPVAAIEVEDTASEVNRPTAKRAVSSVAGLLLNWQGSDKVLDYLVSQIDPGVLQEQPKEVALKLVSELESSQQVLKRIAKGTFKKTAMPGEDPNEAQAVLGIVRKTEELLKAFFMAGEEDETILAFLAGHKVNLINAAKGLVKLKSQYAHSQDKQKLEEVSGALNELDRLVDILPGKEDSHKSGSVHGSYIDRLQGVFSESANPEEIQWKVRKYEAQILELRENLKDRFKALGKKEASPSQGQENAQAVEELIAILEDVSIDLKDNLRFNQAYLSEVREAYNEKFLPKLREHLLKDPENPALLEICKILYTSVCLENECMDTVELFDRLGAKVLNQKPGSLDSSSSGGHPFVRRINTLYKRIDAAPYSAKAPLFNQWGNSARGQWNRNFDPNRQGNPIHVLYQMMVGDKFVKVLGMGTPTIEDKKSNAILSPEFVGFIKAYKREGKRHLFVHNQNVVPKTDFLSLVLNGDETKRSELILNAQDLPELKGALYCIALAKNTSFYSQKDSYKSLNSASEFQAELYKQVFLMPRTESGCYIPQTLKDELPELMDKGKELIGMIHTHLFQGKEELTVEERRLFIETYYDLLTKWIIANLEVDSFNISCKDAIDRGAGSNAKLFATSAIVASKEGELTPLMQKRAEMLMMARALLVRKRAPIAERVERFAESLEFAFTRAKELKALHQAVFKDLHFLPL